MRHVKDTIRHMYALSRVFTPILQCLPKTRTRLLLGHRILLPTMRSGQPNHVAATRPYLRVTILTSAGIFSHAFRLQTSGAIHLERIHSLCPEGDYVYRCTRSGMFPRLERIHRQGMPTFLSTPTSPRLSMEHDANISKRIQVFSCCSGN